MFGGNTRRGGQFFLELRKYGDALDGIDAQVGLHVHIGVQRLRRVAGLGGNYAEQDFLDIRSGGRGLSHGRRLDCGRGPVRRGRLENGELRGRGAGEELLLLVHQGLERALGGFLAFEEPGVEQSGLLLHLLEGGHAFLRDAQGVGGDGVRRS